MSFNGSGTFQINTAGQPVVAGTVITATAFNALTADLATGLSTCVTKDGQTTVTANLPMGGNKLTGLGAGTLGTDSARLSQVQGGISSLLGVSGIDTITGSGSPQVTTYATGQMFWFVASGTNTGAATLNIDSLGAKSITRGTAALAAGDIISGSVALVVYDGTQFQLLSINRSIQVNGTIASATTTNIGAANAEYLAVSGTTTITAFDTVVAGIYRVLKFDGILTLTHNGTSLILPGSASITTAANDVAGFRSLGSGYWRCEWYQRASGAALAAAASSLTGQVAVANGGTGASTLTVNNVLLGNDTSAVQFVAPGTSGNVLTSNGTTWASQASAGIPTATVLDYAGYTAPSGYLLCDGAAVSRTTYSALWAALSASSTVTITIASPGVITWNSHPLQNGDPVRLQTTGALPTGLTANTTYYVVSAAANTFQLASTRAGSAINTSGSQSGTHTAIYAPYGWGDNSTTFNVPDLRGRTTAGRDNMGGTAANRLTTAGSGIAGVNLGDAGGTQTHTLTTTEIPSHLHQMSSGAITNAGSSGGCFTGYWYTTGSTPLNTANTGGGGAHQNTQPTAIVNKIIKT